MQGPSSYNVFNQIIIIGLNGGEFFYNATGTTLIYSNVSVATTDPLLGGTVLAGTTWYQSGGVININNGVIYVYAPTAGANKMVASIAPAVTFDQFGNVALAGISFYAFNAGSSVYVAVNMTPNGGQPGLTWFASPGAAQTSYNGLPGFVTGDQFGDVSVTSNVSVTVQSNKTGGAALQLNAPSGGVDSVTTQFLIQAAAAAAGTTALFEVDGTVALKNASGPAGAAGFAWLYSAAGQLAYVNPAGLAMNAQGSQLASVAGITVVAAALNDITAGGSIPANDAKVGATYRLTAWGQGVQGSTQQTLRFALALGGVVIASFTFPTSFIAASAAFRWKAIAELTCVTTGSGGTWSGTIEATANTGLPVAISNDAVDATGPAGVAVSTIVTNNMRIQVAWGATTGAPTITSNVNYFERVA